MHAFFLGTSTSGNPCHQIDDSLLLSSQQENPAPNKNPWDTFKNPSEYQHYTTINVLDTEAKDALELRPAEWEKCLNLPLDVQEGDFQTEV